MHGHSVTTSSYQHVTPHSSPHILTPEHPIRTSLICLSPHISAMFQHVPTHTPHLVLRMRMWSSGHVLRMCVQSSGHVLCMHVQSSSHVTRVHAHVIDTWPLECAIAHGLPCTSLPDGRPSI